MNTTTTTTPTPKAASERRQALSELLGAKPANLNLAYCYRVKGWTLERFGRGGIPLYRDRRGVLFASSQDFVAELGRESVLREVLAALEE